MASKLRELLESVITLKIMLMRTISIIVVALYSASVCATISDLVMCFGTDGHIAIEQASAGSCESSTGEVADVAARFSSSGLTDYHCSSCEDVPFLLDDSTKAVTVKVDSVLSYPPFTIYSATFSFVPNRSILASTSNIFRPAKVNTSGFGSALLLI